MKYERWFRKKFIERLLALLLLSSLCLGGCGRQAGIGETASGNGTMGAGGQTVMGRYMESTLEGATDLGRINGFTKQEDGSYITFAYNEGVFRSRDGGETWQLEKTPWLEDMPDNTYISKAAAGYKGEFLLICNTVSEGVERTMEEIAASEQYLYIDANQEIHKIPIGVDAFPNGVTPQGCTLLQDGTAIFYFTTGEICSVSVESGKLTPLFETEGAIDALGVTSKYLVIVDEAKSYLYDVAAKILLGSDKTLDSFLQNHFPPDAFGLGSNAGQSLLILEGETEDGLYLALNKGLYHYVVGGTVLEQLIDGNLGTLGNPSSLLMGMIAQGNGNFLMQFSDGRMLYQFDESVPAVPSVELKVYSLEENATVRQAISHYQKNNSEIYVQYEVGLSDMDGVTKEDAVKNLNTKFMTKEGPDVLILDGLTQSTYQEKGLLADIKPLLDEMEKESPFFTNITHNGEQDGLIYAVPTRFEVPILFGEQAVIEQVKDLNTLAETVEELRQQNPAVSLLGVHTAEELLKLLMLNCEPAWMEKNGSVSKESLISFLTESKRIYQAEIGFLTEADLQDYLNFKRYYMGNTEENYLSTAFGTLAFFKKEQLIAPGKIYTIGFDFGTLVSVMKQRPGSDFVLWNGQAENVFFPTVIASVGAQSSHPEEALGFLKQLLSTETQKVDMGEGFSVNQKAFQENMVNLNGDAMYGAMGMDNGDGTTTSLDMWWPGEEEIQDLTTLAESLTTPNTAEPMLEETVLSLAPEALMGEKSIEEAADDIVNKLQMRMAE